MFLIERPRARRYPFAASIELVEMESENETREQTSNLSVFGCQVSAQKPFVAGTRVRLRIIHRASRRSFRGARPHRKCAQKRHGRGVPQDRAEGSSVAGEMAGRRSRPAR